MQCPACGTPVAETRGSTLSPYINTYHCPGCGWGAPRCGDPACDGYLKPTVRVAAASVRYACASCRWTGVAPG